MEYAPRVIEGRVRWELLSSVPSPCRELLERCLAGNESQRGITPGEALRMLAFGTSAAVQQKSLQPRSNLPQPDEMVPLHGRDSDLEWVARALRHGKRGLVVLHGMPGVGKTRLAQEVAQHVARSDPTPWSSVAVWVSLRGLDPASGASGIREAISSALREVGGTGPESSTLSGALGPLLEEASTLLVLDNADHLGMAVASVAAELLHRHPRLRVLITTTDPSPFPASALRRVDPLRPPSMAISSVEEVAANPATALFCAFLAEHVPGFRVTAKTAPSIAAICARLGGIPMAMRLVASVGARFDPPEMLRNLDSIIGARLSQAGAYASVDQILDAGLSPLPANEAQLLGRLAVFSGGWSQELAESICADSGSPKESPSVAGQPLWAVMEWLERRGIVQAVGRGRRDLLDPFRRRAAAMLDRSGERPEVEERLRSTMLELVRQSIVGHEPPGWNQTQWLSRLAAEGDNLRVMWRLCCELKDRATRGEALTTIVRGLELLWQERGVPAHAKDWVAEALAYEAELHGSRERMSLFNAAGNVAMHAGCHAEADALWVRAASVAESASAARHKVIFEANRTLSAARQDDGARAIEHADAALRLAEACGLITDPTADPGSLSTQVLQARLARAHGLKCLERLGEARQEYEGLERPLRALGDHRRLYHVYLGLTQVDILERRPSSGRRRLREARRAFRAQRGPNADRWFVVVLHAKLWALDGGHPSIARRAKRAWLRFIDLGGRPGPFLGGFQEP